MEDIVIKTLSTPNEMSTLIKKEWLETNQLGSYASSTLLNCHTRKYHGLLIAELKEPPGKFVLLSQLEEKVKINDQEYKISYINYNNTLDLKAYSQSGFCEFRQGLYPQFIYHLGPYRLIKSIMMIKASNTTLVQYELEAPSQVSIELQLKPFLAMRAMHELMSANSYLQSEVKYCSQGIFLHLYDGMPPLFLQMDSKNNFNLKWINEPCWHYGIQYSRELERGYLSREDLYSPGVFNMSLSTKNSIIFSASTEKQSALSILWEKEKQRRSLLAETLKGDSLEQRLQLSAKSFLKSTHNGQLSVIAGYHWFDEWGRDAMIALPGLTLINGNFKACLQILQHFMSHIKQGLLPNTILQNQKNSQESMAAYRSVDASLWFTWVVQQYWYATKNLEIVAMEFWPTLKSIFKNYQIGTQYDIHMRSGLIWAGDPNQNISWMDAVINGKPVTPRYGYQVEVNALWYNFLGLLVELSALLKDADHLLFFSFFKAAKCEFQKTFCYTEKGYLFDFVNDCENNMDIRPNQIFAISLPYTPLNRKQGRKVLEVVKKYLYTPYGLRTLAQDHSHYVSTYRGNQPNRDAAYHQGCVWPWLLAHFAAALLRFHSQEEVISFLKPTRVAMNQHMLEHGIGSISELFAGDEPHEPHGCISQAWSVAEVLRMFKLLN